jgi:hypothetical protein
MPPNHISQQYLTPTKNVPFNVFLSLLYKNTLANFKQNLTKITHQRFAGTNTFLLGWREFHELSGVKTFFLLVSAWL